MGAVKRTHPHSVRFGKTKKECRRGRQKICGGPWRKAFEQSNKLKRQYPNAISPERFLKSNPGPSAYSAWVGQGLMRAFAEGLAEPYKKSKHRKIKITKGGFPICKETQWLLTNPKILSDMIEITPK